MHMQIAPFTRRCTCPTRPRAALGHTAACDTTYREEFMASRQNIRQQFYGQVD